MKIFALAVLAPLCLAGCSWDQAVPILAAGCAATQAGIATARANATLLNKPTAAAELATAQTLLETDCPAAQAMLTAALAAAAAAK